MSFLIGAVFLMALAGALHVLVLPRPVLAPRAASLRDTALGLAVLVVVAGGWTVGLAAVAVWIDRLSPMGYTLFVACLTLAVVPASWHVFLRVLPWIDRRQTDVMSVRRRVREALRP